MPEGKHVGQPLKLAPFMRADLRAILDNPHGTRHAIISRGRKNAKTVEAALLMLLHLLGPLARQNGQLYSTAQSRDQASVLFHVAAKMLRMNAGLAEFVSIKETTKQIYCRELGSRFEALSADAKTAYGLSPCFVVHDELGQVRGPRGALYDALETATAAQEDPLSVVISTQAPGDNDLLSLLIDDAATGADTRTVLRLDTAGEELDTFSEAAIKAANPAYGIFMNRREVRDMARAAERMPSRQAEYENLVLNRRVEARNPFITKPVWMANAADPDPAVFRDGPVYIGLDLSKTTDLTAAVAVVKRDGIWHVQPTFWAPEDGLHDRAKRDRVPYDLWAEQGWLKTTPGRSVSYEFVAQWLADFAAENKLAQIAFDRWRIDNLKSDMDKLGIDLPMEPFGQGFVSMAPALDIVEAALLEGNIRHGGHPLLNMCAHNAVVQSDPAGNRKLAKDKSTGRIDGMVALTMAMGAAGRAPVEDDAPMQMFMLG